jgi:hypothetical protein
MILSESKTIIGDREAFAELYPKTATARSRAQTANTVIITLLASASIELLDLPFFAAQAKNFPRAGDHLAHRGNRKTQKRSNPGNSPA